MVVLTVHFAPKTHLWFISLLVTRLLSQNTNPEQIRKFKISMNYSYNSLSRSCTNADVS